MSSRTIPEVAIGMNADQLVIADGHRKTVLKRIDPGAAFRVRMAPAEVVGCWIGGGLKVIATIDPTHHGELVHVSISHRDRFPTWDEITSLRHAFYASDVDVMMVLPRASDYVNVHENCFHLYQTPTAWGIQ
jgi:hypothetical protein